MHRYDLRKKKKKAPFEAVVIFTNKLPKEFSEISEVGSLYLEAKLKTAHFPEATLKFSSC